MSFVTQSAASAPLLFRRPCAADGGGAEGPLQSEHSCDGRGPSAPFRSLRELHSARDDKSKNGARSAGL